jgi:hypothetical protein
MIEQNNVCTKQTEVSLGAKETSHLQSQFTG